MAGKENARSLEETPTWAVAVWLQRKNKPALVEALEKVKAELMLMGFISLLLTVGQGPISDICIPESVASTWHPCSKKKEKQFSQDSTNNHRRLLQLLDPGDIRRRSLATTKYDKCAEKMRKWRQWEDETKTIEYQYHNDPERFRFARDTSFGQRHLKLGSQSRIFLWIVCFFRQLFGSVTKVDSLTLDMYLLWHTWPLEVKGHFQKYIRRSLEEDFKVVVGITPVIWFIAELSCK